MAGWRWQAAEGAHRAYFPGLNTQPVGLQPQANPSQMLLHEVSTTQKSVPYGAAKEGKWEAVLKSWWKVEWEVYSIGKRSVVSKVSTFWTLICMSLNYLKGRGFSYLCLIHSELYIPWSPDAIIGTEPAQISQEQGFQSWFPTRVTETDPAPWCV